MSETYTQVGAFGGEWLIELALELGRPIRIVSGGYRTSTPDTFRGEWQPNRYPSNYESLYEFNEAGGVTIVTAASLSPQQSTRYVDIPVELMQHDELGEAYDVIDVGTSMHLEAELHGLKLGEIDERLLVLYLSPPTDFKFDELATLVRLTVDEEFLATLEQQREQRNEERFLASVQRRDTSEVRELRREIEVAVSNVRDYQRHVEQQRNVLRDQQERLDLMLTRREQMFDEEKGRAEWEALRRHAKIEKLDFTDTHELTVFTSALTIADAPAGPVEVGEFAIKLNLASPSISVRNLTNRRGERDHPHVVEGDFCTGEVNPTLTRLLREQQVAAAVNMAIRTLQTVNPDDDWGRTVEWWYTPAEEFDPDNA